MQSGIILSSYHHPVWIMRLLRLLIQDSTYIYYIYQNIQPLLWFIIFQVKYAVKSVLLTDNKIIVLLRLEIL